MRDFIEKFIITMVIVGIVIILRDFWKYHI